MKSWTLKRNIMEDRGALVADYFVVAGLPDNPEPVDDDLCEGLNPNCKDFEPITVWWNEWFNDFRNFTYNRSNVRFVPDVQSFSL